MYNSLFVQETNLLKFFRESYAWSAGVNWSPTLEKDKSEWCAPRVQAPAFFTALATPQACHSREQTESVTH